MLRSVKAPKRMGAVFKKMATVVHSLFRKNKLINPEGCIYISGERYLLVRADSLSIDFFKCVLGLFENKEKREALHLTQQVLFDMGHTIGLRDAAYVQKTLNITDPLEKIGAGPNYVAHTGWAFVEIMPESNITSDDSFLIVYKHPLSFESEAWIKAGEKSDIPVCIMSSAYSSGWCTQSYNVPLISTEITCRAKGDKECCFIMAHPSRINEYVQKYLEKHPEISSEVTNYEIPDFFKIKKTEKALYDINSKLMAANKQLHVQAAALVEKAHLIELLNKLVGQLATCTTKYEICAACAEYAEKIYPQSSGRLWVYTADEKALEVISKWGVAKDNIDISLPSKQCRILNKNCIESDSFSLNNCCPYPHKERNGYICLPITAGEKTLGVMSIAFEKKQLSSAEKSIFAQIAKGAGLALANVNLRESFQELSIRDFLTGLYNRRYMEEMLIKAIANAKRKQSTLGIIMFDIDKFKDFNDSYGHDAGDTILRTLGQFLKEIFREGDILCRYGGEEFLIILIDANEKKTLDRAEELREKIQNIYISLDNKVLGNIQVSAGVAIFPQHGTTEKSLLKEADKALYQAKRLGRNRIYIANH
ncbi:MAG: diguanylate cyclase [Proteobacteria bacterium]|nr:diguanylate cyclase [Pseudomonadota bacterium]